MINSRYIFSYLILIVTIIAGSVSLLLFGLFLFGLFLFGLFLFGYSFTVIDFGYSKSGALAWNFLLCLMFFVQHSTMIRKAFRNRLTKIVPLIFKIHCVPSRLLLFYLFSFCFGSIRSRH